MNDTENTLDINKSPIKLKAIVKYLVITCISVALFLPVLYMITNSFMSSGEVLRNYTAISSDNGDSSNGTDTSAQVDEMPHITFKLIPDKVSFMQYYNVLLRKPKFLIMFWNSVAITLPIVLGQIIVATLAAYAFSKLKFPFSDKIFFVYIIVMMMPFQVTLVPNYIMLRNLNLLGSLWAIILPGAFSTFGVFLLRQFMMYIPDDYCEAAKIDGAGYLKPLSV